MEKAGIDCSSMTDKKRKLIFHSSTQPISFILVKAVDVMTYVKHGVADIGIVGKDVLMEASKSHYEMLDLEIGKCQFCLASTPDFDPSSYRRKSLLPSIQQSPPNFSVKRSEDVEIIKIEGSVEIAPVLDLADAIIDIVETGSTLKRKWLNYL